MRRILVNKVRCKKCDDVIESKHRHDFQSCRCGAIYIDGGTDYQRCGWGDVAGEWIDQEKHIQSRIILILVTLFIKRVSGCVEVTL